MPKDTLLVIRIGVFNVVANFSARDLTQSLTQIDEAKGLARTIDGGLLDLAPPQMKKYSTTINCTDVNAPALDSLESGVAIQIDCVRRLYYAVGFTPNRTVVPGSEETIGDKVFYRPRIDFVVQDFAWDVQEFALRSTWTLQAVEA